MDFFIVFITVNACTQARASVYKYSKYNYAPTPEIKLNHGLASLAFHIRITCVTGLETDAENL